MIKRIISGLALAAVTASTASAQVLHYTGSPTFNYNGESAYFHTGPNTGNQFQVWCVDQYHLVDQNTDYLVNYSSLGGSLATTRLGNAGLTQYTKAAWLASSMTGNPASETKNRQYAIWAIIHGKSAAQYCNTWGPVDHTSDCSASDVTTFVGDAGDNFGDVVANEWVVITGRSGYDLSDNSANTEEFWDSSDMQELIARCTSGNGGITGANGGGLVSAQDFPAQNCDDPWDPPQDETPTPEPATMSLLALGLAGMAGNTLRRRKK